MFVICSNDIVSLALISTLQYVINNITEHRSLQTRVLINKWNISQLRPWTYASHRLIAPLRPTKLDEADATCQNRR